MTFKSRTPKKEECIMPMQIITLKNGNSINHCHDYDALSPQTKEMIANMGESLGREESNE